jgi:hypothetical protein
LHYYVFYFLPEETQAFLKSMRFGKMHLKETRAERWPAVFSSQGAVRRGKHALVAVENSHSSRECGY